MLLRNLTLGLLLSLLPFSSAFSQNAATLPEPIQHYIQTIAQKYHFTYQELKNVFTHTRINWQLLQKMDQPYEQKPWPQYRNFFLTPERIQGGVAFWQNHQQVLQQAESEYGIPASIIVAILGVETQYGQHQGEYPVIETLTTLGFYYKPRADFFRNELTEFLLLTREQKLQPLKLTGSYAGAIGIPQFMPSSYRRYAIDYSQQGSADLVKDANDAIFSIANYLQKKGWQRAQPVATPLRQTTVAAHLLSDNAKPKRSLASLAKKGIPVPSHLNSKTKAAIIKLEAQPPQTSDYWLTFANFRAIMSYNPRINYAMAVYQLSEAIQNAHRQATITARAKSTPTRTTS